MKVVIMVFRFGHCLNDLLYPRRIGALPINIVAVFSNHMDYQKGVVNHDIPFHRIKVKQENRQEAEVAQMWIIEETGAGLIVLARAIHAHIHRWASPNDNKTAVFPASSGSFASERMG